MTFWSLQQHLVNAVREKVRNGELTERRLARLMGVSQPHLHNVLKGVRGLSVELADQLIARLQLDLSCFVATRIPGNFREFREVPLLKEPLGEEMPVFRPEWVEGNTMLPALLVSALQQPVTARLGTDVQNEPFFSTSDLILIDRSPSARLQLMKHALYVVQTEEGVRLRYIRRGGICLYLASEGSIRSPSEWISFTLGDRHLHDVVGGRVVWVSRQLEAETDESSETSG